jgi:NAD(P)-dependent dehydrogenase (short-subunit alcohol dehydrogenase family)
MHKIGANERPDWPLAVLIGAGGMGVAVARRLSQRHRVLIADIDGTRAETAASSLRSEGGDASAIACDVTSTAAVAAMSNNVRDLGGFRVLTHVAGLSPSASDYATILRVNLTGPALVADALLSLASTGAAAILIASLAAHGFAPSDEIEVVLAQPTHPDLPARLEAVIGTDQATPQRAYQLSKYGLLSYCRRAARAWGERGARIVSLSPGLIATPMGAFEFQHSPRKHQMLAQTPLQREGTMLEIADAVEFLASDRASFISGTDLLVDGGLAAVLFDRRASAQRGDT